jgi:protocatechuate 3,4-dioxygenase beta subunit
MSDRSRLSRRSLLLGAAAFSAASLAPAATPHQTEGPFFPTTDPPDKDFDMTRIAGRGDRAMGEVVEVSGRILDEAGEPVEGALVDDWQANAAGKYDHERDPSTAPVDPAFQGWARLRTGADGRFHVLTIQPGSYPVEDGWDRPPHIHFKIARRGFHELATQMYFAGEALNEVDRLLLAVPEAERAQLVVTFAAADAADESPARKGVFDITLRKA